MPGSIIGGIFGSKAADKQADAAAAAQQTQRQNFLDGLEVMQPSIDRGNRAGEALNFLLGLQDRPTFYLDEDQLGPRPEINVIPGGPQYGTDYGAEYNPHQYDGGFPNKLIGFDVSRYEVGGNEYTTKAEADSALAKLLEEYDAQNPGFEYQGFEASPGYQFRVEEGQKAIDRAMAARGMSNSGALIKNTARFSQGIASDEFNTQLNRLASVAGTGQVASNNAFSGYLNQGNALANLQLQQGNAQASSYAALGQGIGGGVNSLVGLAGFGYGQGWF